MSHASLERRSSREDPQRLPRPLAGEDAGLVVVDATWGSIQPLRVAPGVETVGELEVIEHVRSRGLLVDTRQGEYLAGGLIPGAVHIRHEEIVARREELDPQRQTVLYCNGPQCPATPQAIEALLEAGWPAASLRYYRGGVHDWVTLGLPLDGSPPG